MRKGGWKHWAISLGLIVGGLAALKYGSEWLVHHGSALALWMGVSEAIIALFLIAVGTSLPELATSLIAVKNGNGDIITGNAVGSNIFNILCVMGITAMISPVYEGNIAMTDKMVMLVLTFIITIFMSTRNTINRVEGGVLLVGYFIYIGVRYSMDQGFI